MKAERRQEITMEVMVGAFFFMILLALGIFTIILSRQTLFRQTYPAEVRFEEVQGAREGDQVMSRGVEIGKVRKVQADAYGVTLKLTLNRPLRLHQDYRIEILSASVFGGQYVSIHEGSEKAPLLPAETSLHGEAPPGLIDEATRTVQRVRQTLDEEGLLDDLRSAVADLKRISGRVSKGEGTVGKLFNEDQLYQDVEDIAADLREVTRRIRAGEGSLGKLLNDNGKLYEGIESTVTNLQSVAQDLADGKGLLGRLMSDEDTVYDDLRSAASSLRELTAGIERGEGTLGRLAKDPSLYDETRQLIAEARETVDDLRETAPITTFTSIFFGAF